MERSDTCGCASPLLHGCGAAAQCGGGHGVKKHTCGRVAVRCVEGKAVAVRLRCSRSLPAWRILGCRCAPPEVTHVGPRCGPCQGTMLTFAKALHWRGQQHRFAAFITDLHGEHSLTQKRASLFCDVLRPTTTYSKARKRDAQGGALQRVLLSDFRRS